MGMKDVFKRYLVFVIGLYFLAAGIVLIVRSALGTTPISSINYVLSLNSPLSLGTCTFLINMLLILGQFWIIRKNKTRQDTIEILLQLPFSFIFSAFIDFNMALTSNLHPDNYGISIALLLTGCMIQSIGVVLELKPKVAMMSAEAFVKYASRRYNKESVLMLRWSLWQSYSLSCFRNASKVFARGLLSPPASPDISSAS